HREDKKVKGFRRVFALLLCLTLVFTMLVACSNDEGTETKEVASVKSGKYIGTASGYGGQIKVEVELGEDNIEGIKVLEHSETVRISEPAFERIPKDIIDNQSINVDAISGCTSSSMGIKLAVEDAIEKA